MAAIISERESMSEMIERCQREPGKQCLDGWSLVFPGNTECYKVRKSIQELNGFMRDGAVASYMPSNEIYLKGDLIGGDCHDGGVFVTEKVVRIIRTDIPMVYIATTDDGSYYFYKDGASFKMRMAIESDGMRPDICEIISSKQFGDEYL